MEEEGKRRRKWKKEEGREFLNIDEIPLSLFSMLRSPSSLHHLTEEMVQSPSSSLWPFAGLFPVCSLVLRAQNWSLYSMSGLTYAV